MLIFRLINHPIYKPNSREEVKEINRERKRILEVLGLDECDMEQVYRALGRDEESIQGTKGVTRALDNRLLAWELCRKRLWWQLAAGLAALAAVIAAGL